MAMVPPPPPPPPPPPQSRYQTNRNSDPPVPQHAAMPYFFNENHPVQETSPVPEAQNGTQVVADIPEQHQTQSQPLLVPGQADSPSAPEGKYFPVQETDPAPQTQNGSQANHLQPPREDMAADPLMDPAGED